MFHTGLGVAIPLLLYICIIAGSLWSVAKDPRIGFYVLIPMLPLQRLRSRLFEYPLGEHVVLLLIVCIVVGLFLHRHTLPRSRFNVLLLAYGLFIYFSLWQGAVYLNAPLPISPTNPRVADFRDYMLMFALCPIAAAACRTRRDIKIVVALMVFAIIMAGRSYMMEAGQHSTEVYSETARESGPLGFVGVNGMAAFEVNATLLLAGLALYEKKFLRRWAWYAVIAFNLVCILFTYTRGAYVTIALGTLIIALTKKRILLVGILLFAVSYNAILPASVKQRIAMTQDNQTGELDQSSAERIELWKDAMGLFASDPILGTGWDTYQFMNRHATLKDTHNLFVKTLVETGVLGLVFLLAIFAGMIKLAWRTYRDANDVLLRSIAFGLLLIVCLLPVQNMFGDRWRYLEMSGYIWILLGMMQRALAIEKEAQETQAALEEPASPAELELNPA